MNRERLEADLVRDEGQRLKVYMDTTGNLTVGIGHKVLPADHLHAGQVIDTARMYTLFRTDLDKAIQACATGLQGWDSMPETAHEVLVNMVFNMGLRGVQQFVNTLYEMRQGHWRHAAEHMRHSKWYTQVGQRAERLCQRLEALEPLEG